MTSKTLVSVLLFLASPIATASGPVVIGPGAFSGNETVIDFESIAQDEQITTQFSALGVTFSGDLFGDTINLFFFGNTDPGNVIACNFIDSTCGPPVGCSGSWTVDFSPPVTRVGFDAITNGPDDTTLTVFRSNVQTGSITFDTSLLPDSFVGIEDSGGIDRVIVDAANIITGAICINNFRFEGASCPLDLNDDGNINVLDLIQLVMSFGPCEDCPADFNDDGFVNVLDLIELIMNFGPCPGVPCVWDVNGDGVVDESDVQAVTNNLGPCDGCPEDVNGDGVVNGQDAAAVATHFGPCP